MLTYDAQRVAAYVARFAGKPFSPPFVAFGVERDGEVIGGFVFNGYTGPSIEVSLAGRAVISREAWREVLRYVFVQCGCARLGMATPVTNRGACVLARKAGMVYEGPGRRECGAVNSARFSLTVDDLPKFRERWHL